MEYFRFALVRICKWVTKALIQKKRCLSCVLCCHEKSLWLLLSGVWRLETRQVSHTWLLVQQCLVLHWCAHVWENDQLLALLPPPLMPLRLHISLSPALVSGGPSLWQIAAKRVERQQRSVVTNNDRGWMNEKAMAKTLFSCWLKLFVFCPGTGRPMSHFSTVASFCYTRAPMFRCSIYKHLNRYRKQ